MKSFRQYLEEAFLLENKAWHQFIGQHGDAILDKLGQLTNYRNNTNPGEQTPESKTNVISHFLGLHDLTTEEGRWVLKNFHGGGIQREEDVHSTVIPNLKRLRQARAEGKSDASLARIQGAGALHAHLAKVYPVSDESLGGLSPDEYTVHGENEHWSIVQPRTKTAACAVGRGTNWCTASTGEGNRFQHYSEKAPLYALIPKAPKYKGERYQINVPVKDNSEDDEIQFMNEKDLPVWNNSKNPEQMQVLSDPNRPLPEIKDSEARGAIHGMRDYMHYQNIHTDNHTDKQEHLSKILDVPTESDTQADRMKAAHLASAKYTHPVSHKQLRDALTKGGREAVKEGMRYVDDMGYSERKKLMTPDVVGNLLDNKDPIIRSYGARHIYDPEQMHRALRDPDPLTAQWAIPHFGPRRSAMRPEHVQTALEHPSDKIHIDGLKWALDSMRHHDRKNWSARDKQTMDIDNVLTKAITGPSEKVRKYLAQYHPMALSDEHVFQILHHSPLEHTKKHTDYDTNTEREITSPGVRDMYERGTDNEYTSPATHRNYQSFFDRVTPKIRQRLREAGTIKSPVDPS
jgi:hypothetical protein